jgi:hypothetical protein
VQSTSAGEPLDVDAWAKWPSSLNREAVALGALLEAQAQAAAQRRPERPRLTPDGARCLETGTSFCAVPQATYGVYGRPFADSPTRLMLLALSAVSAAKSPRAETLQAPESSQLVNSASSACDGAMPSTLA